MMANIKGRDTKPEIALRKAMHAKGLRFRLHARNIAGRPDLVFPKFRAAVFVHGCFWHRHTACRFATTPATRPEFWMAKFSANVARDRRVIADLQANGWRVATIWECAIRKLGPTSVADELGDWLSSERFTLTIES